MRYRFLSKSKNNGPKYRPDKIEGELVAGGNVPGSALNQFNFPFGIVVDGDSIIIADT